MITVRFLVYFLLCSLLICTTVGSTIGNAATGGDETCCITLEDQQQLCRTLYLLQNIQGLPDANQLVIRNATVANDFGTIAINDWEIVDGLDQNAKVVARAQGLHFGVGMNKPQWYSSQNILFEDDDTLKGSSLEVRGQWTVGNGPFQWAIVGGTGQLTFAQGIISANVLSEVNLHRIVKLSLQALYRPMKSPNPIYSP